MAEVKRALVLAGGNLKGAFQAGALETVLSYGFQPDIITGISVGALNAGLLAEYAGTNRKMTGGDMWANAGAQLTRFWRDNVQRPDQFVTKRSALDLGYRILSNRWAGILDTSRLRAKLKSVLAPGNSYFCSAKVQVGAVNLRSGELHYNSLNDDLRDGDWVMASTAEPLTMPPVVIGDGLWVDGGIREIAPLNQAINLGATQIIVIATSPELLPVVSGGWSGGSFLDQAERTLSILTHETLRNDLAAADRINDAVVQGTDSEHRYIEIAVIRPYHRLLVSNVAKFTAADIAMMIKLGHEAADDTMVMTDWWGQKLKAGVGA